MAVLAIEWLITQRVNELDTMTWDHVMDHFLKACKHLHDFCACFCKVYIHAVLLPDTFICNSYNMGMSDLPEIYT